jgi:hypothetical protein
MASNMAVAPLASRELMAVTRETMSPVLARANRGWLSKSTTKARSRSERIRPRNIEAARLVSGIRVHMLSEVSTINPLGSG